MMLLENKLKGVALSLGLFVSYSIMAVFREQIFKNNYNGEKFIFPITFSAIQLLINSISAKGLIMISKNQEDNETPQKYYIVIAIFNVLTMITSNMALQFIPYVVLVVGKACKPIPVMIFTAIIAKKYYEFQRYIFVTMIAFGVGLFMYKEGVMTTNEMLMGNVLIFMSLFLEGFLGGSQSKMRIQSKPSSINYMFYVNAWCTVLIIPLIFINFEIFHFVKFCTKHNEAGFLVLLYAIIGTIGHYFTSAIISNFGPIPLSLITTIRKFFTVFLSSFIFGNVLSLMQWIATVIIFEALALDIFFGKSKFKICTKSETVEGTKVEKTNAEINENVDVEHNPVTSLSNIA